MKKRIIYLLGLIICVSINTKIYAQEVESTFTLDKPLTEAKTVEATESITLLPGFSATGLTPFIARIVSENIYDVVKGSPYAGNEALNWVSSSTYDLSGNLTSSGVSYFNTLGKATQTHSLDIKTGKIWVNEVRYDAFGRPVFSTLSAPTGTQYGYKNNFITTKSGNALSTSNIESIKDNSAPEIIGNQENTLGWYYSESNTSEKYQDITAHPYSKVVYSTLNPGLGLRTLGGNKIKKTSGSQPEWLQSYSFSMPMAQELFYEFERDYFPKRELIVIKNGFKAGPRNSSFYYKYDIQEVSETGCTEIGELHTGIRLADDELLRLNGIYRISFKNGIRYYKVISRQYFNRSTLGGDEILRSNNEGGMSNPIETPIGSGPDTDIREWAGLMERDEYNCPSGRPTYIRGKKTIVRDVHGVESLVFTDSDGNVLAAARSGNEDGEKPKRKVISPINKQGYVDIHIPKGCADPTGFTNPVKIIGQTSAYKIYDLITEKEVSLAYVNANPGFYRIKLLNSSYNPEFPYVKLIGDSPSLLEPNTTTAVEYDVNYYDYSLNYYDKSNRLVKSTQPVSKLVASEFKYNTLGQLVEVTSPDIGKSEFKYRKDGQIRFSQNAQQKILGEFSYINYDNLGRPVESGVVSGSYELSNPDIEAFTGTRKEQNFTVYDETDTGLPTVLANAEYSSNAIRYKQEFLSGNVSKTYTQNPTTTTTWYSYDVYGRVTWMLQDIEGLGIRSIDYEYDFTKGQLTKVIYQKYHTPQADEPKDYFEHKYTYNIAGELYKVETSTNGKLYKEQAKYKYYETGALKRVEVAENVQGIDYIYNLRGQLKAINHPSRNSSLDPGKDGINNMPSDLFGFAIDYYNGDYTRANTPTPVTVGVGHENYNQYNGNIKATRWSTSSIDNGSQASQLFSYNKNNWLKTANFGIATNAGSIIPNSYGNYKVDGLTYDANGNIITLNRNANGDTNNAMDRLTYNYRVKEKPNRLSDVHDAIGKKGVEDIDNQDENNYVYNSLGQLKENKKEKVKYEYNVSGLVTKVLYNNVLKVQFYYNDKGFRVKKEKYNNGTVILTTHYVRDASGSVMAIYEDQEQKELPIYGTSRLGMYNKVDGSAVYQLTDHLGNVRAIVGKSPDGSVATTSSTGTDYYPFGMPMPSRQIVNGEKYRYGYQGDYAEKEDIGSTNSFEERLWDSRIGKWLSPDPAGKGDSPYTGMYNNPIKYLDTDGRDTLIFHLSKRLAVKGYIDVHMLTFSVEVNGKRKALNHNYLMFANHLAQQKKGNSLTGGRPLHPKTGKEIIDIRFQKMANRSYVNSIFITKGGRSKFAHAGNNYGDWDGCWGICKVNDLMKKDAFEMDISFDKGDTHYIKGGNRARFVEIRNIYEKVKKLYNLNGQHILLELNSNARRLSLNHNLKPKPIKIISPRNFE
ncbi:RHS repeat domain-containing protein [Tenacibaculum aiptasiae]|uniref:RHS repeat domain-containing protein n=1 Tax=Tenacibaculum aiptasiae TaxID=426481 RepID=UPI00232CF9CE|nr:RHS repeat-associated core domain-containing protein [Tenacibaculum aiptasiae]